MTVVRVKKTDNFVTLYKACLQDTNISLKAKGFWAYCMGQPDDWTFHVTQLASVLKEGEDAIYSAIKELIENGYCKRIQNNINGKFQTVDYEISEIPDKLKKCLPHRGFPDAEDPGLLSIDILPKIEEEDNIPHNPQRGTDVPKSKKREKIKEEYVHRAIGVETTPTQHQRLIEKLKGDEAKVQACYDYLADWKAKKEITGGKDMYQITDWVIRAVESKQKTQEPSLKAEKLIEILKTRKDLIQGGHMILGRDYVEFPLLRYSYFKFTDKGFVESVLNTLRKMNIHIDL